MAASPVERTAKGARLRVRLTPSGPADRIAGLALDADGIAWLAASVTAAPEDGKANKALVKLLAKALKLAKSEIDIVSGATARRKTFAVALDADALEARLAPWIEEKKA